MFVFNAKLKGLSAVALSIVLAMGMITGCGKSTADSQKKNSATAQPAKQTEDGGKSTEARKVPTTLKEIALYEGADRNQWLVEAAKKEGELTLYGSPPVEDMKKLTDEFTKKYGIKVSIWRSGSENVLERVLKEAKANMYADVVMNNAPEMEAMHREKVLQEVKSQHLKDLIPAAIPQSHKDWIGAEFLIFVQEYNTNKVKKEDLPKKYEDLADPKWKGKLAIEAQDYNWFGTVVNDLGEQNGLRLFRDLVNKNGMTVRKGHSLLAEMVATGEVDYALTVFNYKAEQLKRKGRPVDWYAIEPALAVPLSIGVLQGAKHPNAAVLFFDYVLGQEGQKVWAGLDHAISNKTVESKLNKLPIKAIDPALLMDDKGKWTKLFEDIIVTKK